MIPENPMPVHTQKTASEYLLRIEERHRISIGIWISLDADSSGQPFFNVHVTGSGDQFDHMPNRFCSAKARIVSSFPDPFAAALWQCLIALESALFRFSADG